MENFSGLWSPEQIRMSDLTCSREITVVWRTAGAVPLLPTGLQPSILAFAVQAPNCRTASYRGWLRAVGGGLAEPERHLGFFSLLFKGLLNLEKLLRQFLISKDTLSVRMLDDSRDPTPLLKEIRDDKTATIIVHANASMSHTILQKVSIH